VPGAARRVRCLLSLAMAPRYTSFGNGAVIIATRYGTSQYHWSSEMLPLWRFLNRVSPRLSQEHLKIFSSLWNKTDYAYMHSAISVFVAFCLWLFFLN
jgi:hypothetical protein